MDTPLPAHSPSKQREKLLLALSAAAMLIFFQAYMIAPIVPRLAEILNVSERSTGLLVPAYVLPYGISCLFYGPLADRVGRRKVLGFLLLAMVPITALTATAQTIHQLIIWRALTGIATGGVIPLTLALIAELYDYTERGRPLGWVFGAIAGGMAIGSSGGALLLPVLGWRGLFLLVAGLSAGLLAMIAPHHRLLGDAPIAGQSAGKSAIAGYLRFISDARARRVFSYIFVNGVFHSGVFTWLGPFLLHRYHLTEPQVGWALVGYGVPGLLFGPTIGHWADRIGRRWIITAGLFGSAAICAAFSIPMPLWLAMVLVTGLSLGFDMTHPLLAGIVTTLNPQRRGQLMAFNAFVLFTGFGLGSLAFDALLNRGFGFAFGVFAAVLAGAGIFAPVIFQRETVRHHATIETGPV